LPTIMAAEIAVLGVPGTAVVPGGMEEAVIRAAVAGMPLVRVGITLVLAGMAVAATGTVVTGTVGVVVGIVVVTVAVGESAPQ
jgi:hypothetical protein